MKKNRRKPRFPRPQSDRPEDQRLEDATANEDDEEEPIDPLAPMTFELSRTEVPVTLVDPKTKERQVYLLRELDGKSRDRYLNNLGARTRTEKGATRVTNFDGLQASLLVQSMFRMVPKEGAIPTDKETDVAWLKANCNEAPIKTEAIQDWPAQVQEGLFDRAKLISGLGQDSEDDAGND